MSLSPESEARIDATIARYQAWHDAGRCYACGEVATRRVTLPWMLRAHPDGRQYCGLHAGEWASAGYARFVEIWNAETAGETT